MTRNQKIALGCGGAGCLGLIVVAVAACLVYYFVYRQAATYRASTRDYNYNVNYNSNSNSNYDSNSNSNSSTTTSASSLSDDDKHKLFHAASVTGDTELMHRVQVAIGLLNDDYSPKDEYRQFATAHVAWVFKNMDFIQEVNTPEKAKAYIDEHLQ
jgi:hypothetical protein